jgi:hypothetical protein
MVELIFRHNMSSSNKLFLSMAKCKGYIMFKLTCSNAPSEVVLTDIQYKCWCSTSCMQQCSQWSCIDWHTIQAMMQYILYAAMLPVKLCWLTYNTSVDAVHLTCIILWNKKIDTFVKRKKNRNVSICKEMIKKRMCTRYRKQPLFPLSILFIQIN